MITYLYHKRHGITGLNYFGKTVRNPYKYNGSGLYWKRHLAQHGNYNVKAYRDWETDRKSVV